jgi:hypothetical protein
MCFRKLPGNFSDNFLSREHLVTQEIIMWLHLKKVKIYGCKHTFYLTQFRNVPQGKVPLKKNPPENISDNFVKFWKFFPTGEHSGKFQEKFHKSLIIKNIISSLLSRS